MSFADILSGLDAKARARLERKLPSWAGKGIDVPASLNLEQCSSEATAIYKASLVDAGARVADLTGGLGADSWAFSRRASAVWYNERDAALLDAVKRNFAVLVVSNAEFCGYDISASADDWKQALSAFKPDFIYLDPARRSASGRKVFLLEDCSPDVVSLMPQLLELAPKVMVKVSPMADLTMLRRRLSGCLESIHVVGADGECKELLCLCCKDAVFSGVVLAENGFVLTSRGSDSGGTEAEGVPGNCGRPWPHERGGPTSGAQWGGRSEAEVSGNTFCAVETESGLLLFVPSAAMVKSGLGPGMGLMAYDEGLSHFGKFWQVVENLPFASSVLKSVGARYPQAEVTARGVLVSSEELRAKMKTKPGGSVHIFACMLGAERRLLVCK
ncbi:MAG: hypothetical protein J5759_06200 [Bacteroidales bacterium]|nr:hypothetical protein [Bacteroidales bacterium]